mgnify:FL=1
MDTVSIISHICRSAEAVFDHHQHFEAQAEAEEQLLEFKRSHQSKVRTALFHLT